MADSPTKPQVELGATSGGDPCAVIEELYVRGERRAWTTGSDHTLYDCPLLIGSTSDLREYEQEAPVSVVDLHVESTL